MDGSGLGKDLPLWSIIPFVTLLLAIAILPLLTPHWWEKNRNKALISFICALPVAVFFIIKDIYPLLHEVGEYGSFIILLSALFIVSGGIHIKGAFAGTPLVNTGFLAVGSILASFIGTTGASMLLIRPLLRANRHRRDKAHIVVFFIFLVSNIGGCLTPLGDPPLFLGFIRGVPFEWTLQLFPQWAFTVGILLLIFNLYDQYRFNREDVATPGALTEEVQPKRRFHIEGRRNFIFLMGIVGVAFLSGHYHWSKGIQEGVMVLMAVLSLKCTPRTYREANGFTFHPIIEVAVLFAGIFVTMIPALLILNARGGELAKACGFELNQAWQFFWTTGALSSFLDNAPTYLTFTSLASNVIQTDANRLLDLVQHPQGARFLVAISCGAVFMGANTYIGNGPNFMVKAIAEENKVKMPSFFGYMVWTLFILIPVFVLVTFIFF